MPATETRTTLRTFSISRANGRHIGTFEATSPAAALDALARREGYENQIAAFDDTGEDWSRILSVTGIGEVAPDA